MKLESQDTIDQPVDTVYQTVRDDLANLAPYLPNVDKIVCETKKSGKTGPKIVNRWYAKAELPALLQKIIKPELLSWIDKAEWDDNSRLVRYTLESSIGNNLFEASGVNYFHEAPDGKTQLRITCEVTLHPENLPGVPKLLAGKVLPMVEGLLKKMLEPNLMSLAEGLKGYYAQSQKKSKK